MSVEDEWREFATDARRRRLWCLVHNCVAHPLLGIWPGATWAHRFHDRTFELMRGRA